MVGRLEQSIRFGRVGMMKLRPDYVAKVGLKRLGRRPSVVVGGQYKFFAMLTKRTSCPALAGAWLFGTLIRIAIGDKTLLDPTLDLAEPTRKTKTSMHVVGHSDCEQELRSCLSQVAS